MKQTYLYALLAVTIWGLSFVSTKAVLQEVTPHCLIFIRLFLAIFFLGILNCFQHEGFRIKRKHIYRLIWLSLIGVFLHQMIQATALQFTGATSAGWLIALSPVFSVIISFLFYREKMKLFQFLGFIIAIIGVLIITSKGQWGNLTISGSYGDLLVVLSALNWAIYSIFLKQFNLPYSSLTITFYLSLIGCLLLSPFIFLNSDWVEIKKITVNGWIHLGFLGIFSSAIAYWFWGRAVGVLGSTKVSVFLYMEPLATALAAVIELHEVLLPSTLIGGVLIILGVITINNQLNTTFLQRVPRMIKSHRSSEIE